jgi:hypothetical protein
MKHGMVECKECRFWVPYTEEELEMAPGLEDIGLCHQFRSSNWLMRMQKDQYCGHGQLPRD